MDNCEHSSECHIEHHHHGQEEMDVAETGDASLDKLKSVLHEYGADGVFTPLDGTALFSMLCKINHSCDPNVRVKYVFTREHGMVARLVALKDIKPDEELLQSYIDQSMGKRRECHMSPVSASIRSMLTHYTYFFINFQEPKHGRLH
jgi:SET domain